MAIMTYTVAHAEIDGSLVDRERGWPALKLEVHPIGIALPPDRQTKELHISIGASKTVIDARGMQGLLEFLENNRTKS